MNVGNMEKLFIVAHTLFNIKDPITVRSPMNVRNERKTFIVHGKLIWHQSIQTGEKPFVCKECGKALSTFLYLVQHQ